ncbi:GAF domain-containing protein [Paracoccus hibiscisoli]|uniref:GAF domain-containing protein n=1 Tax=Paracoccus hibiscisoli TaxID=2023261 RepID=A0A4U0QEI5_9RHOB|nr:GAF domain-containing protein [Paracoccus hibiscisoli]TJZ79796.1 GAF domain-containing protein [Paracoccus hibiscisoli]TJZ79828.1 GAF domain-containing protein [Paracoccus hibiscisoli]
MSDPKPEYGTERQYEPASQACQPDSTSDAGDRIVSRHNVVRLTNSGLLLPARTPMFDRVVDQTRRIFNCRASMLTIIDEENDRQFFKAESGLASSADDARETSLAYSFCKTVVQNSAPLVIKDARNDPRVTGHEAIARFDAVAYLGVPIKDETGQAIAALCLVEPVPRNWTSANIEVLQAFAEGVSTQIKSMFWAEKARTENSGITRDVPFRIGKIVGASLTYHHGPDGTERIENASRETADIWGMLGHVYADTYSDVFGMCLVEDYPLARASFGNSAAGMIPWHHKWRIRTPQGQVKWLEGHGLPVPSSVGGILWKCIVSDVTPVFS